MNPREAHDDRWVRELSAREPALPAGDVLRDLLASDLDDDSRQAIVQLDSVRETLDRVALLDSEIMSEVDQPILQEDLDRARRWSEKMKLGDHGVALASTGPDQIAIEQSGADPLQRKGWHAVPLWMVAMATIAAVATFLVLWPGLGDEPGPLENRGNGLLLGTNTPHTLWPDAEWDGLAPLLWEVTLPRGGWVELSFFADRDGQRAERVGGPARVRSGSSFSIPADHPVRDLEAWHWEVASFSGSGIFLDVARAVVSVSGSVPGSESGR